MTDFENMYYALMGRIIDLQEYLECIETKDHVLSDTEQFLSNIIEETDEKYINQREVCIIS
ncbi:MAG: hypothetical protein ACI4JM_06815 [Oscillospiraceae bacterium]